MVPITIVNGVYKPSYNWGAPHCSYLDDLASLGTLQWMMAKSEI